MKATIPITTQTANNVLLKNILLYCGIISSLRDAAINIYTPNIATNELTPTIGTWERINIGLFMLWVVAFALQIKFAKSRNEASEVA